MGRTCHCKAAAFWVQGSGKCKKGGRLASPAPSSKIQPAYLSRPDLPGSRILTATKKAMAIITVTYQ
jgi:hypothetical protein